ncbi:hypothetical protein ACVWZR_005133 [Bradyrhizobium sp. i1.3.1]
MGEPDIIRRVFDLEGGWCNPTLSRQAGCQEIQNSDTKNWFASVNSLGFSMPRWSVRGSHPTVPPLRISPLSQQLTDRPDVFAPPKIQKALQMALRMVELVRAKGGGFIARKGIPADVRDDYERLYGVRWEAQLRIPSGTPIPFAKSQHGEWLAEIETRIAALRAHRNGEGQPLGLTL